MYRIGHGFDFHATCLGDKIILGGIVIDAPYAIESHSDGDVLLHALTDALLGAIADKDIGYYFPPSSEENRNRKSSDFVEFAVEKVHEQGYYILNVDSTVICEKPKIKTAREEIKENLARLLQISENQVGLKGKTMEGLGPIGRLEGISCHTNIMLVRQK